MTTPILPTRWVIGAADTADDADIFPFLKGQGFLIKKTPQWSGKTDIAVSGRERRRSLWSYPIWHFSVGHEFLRDAAAYLEIQKLYAFFNSRMGSVISFFYFDRFDYSVTANQFGTGDGTTTTFQVTRTTTIGNITFTEPVRGFNGTPTIYVNGVATTAFTVGTLGQITFTTAPAFGAVLTWTGSFFFLCRFDKDSLDNVSQIASGFWANGSLDFSSFKP